MPRELSAGGVAVRRMRRCLEVASARWLPLSDHKRLNYRGEQGAARETAELLGA
jgi:hypothetical protein